MRILFFDTETNGLPSVRNAQPNAIDVWPSIVQIAWQLVEWNKEKGREIRVLESSCFIVQPDPAMRWSEESARIHGISKERADTEGTPRSIVFPLIHALLGSSDCIIAHNLAFDKPVLTCELIRQGFSPTFPALEYCTMEKTKALCKLPTPFSRPSDPYKFPKLSELYTYLFGSVDGISFHSAEVDVICLVRCFQELVNRGFIEL
jgi:DNA polymerase III epsilon subunit-like protein